MRCRIAAAVAAALLVTGFAPAARAAEPDWVLIKFTAGPSGVEGLQWGAGASFASTGADVATMATGVGKAGFSFVPVFGLGGAPMKLSSTSEAGGVDVTVRPGTPSGGGIGTGAFMGNLGPGESAAQLFFGAGSVVTAYQIEHQFTAGSVTVSVTSGTGSRALLPVHPDHGGVAVQAGTAAAGSSTTGATAGTGIAGGFTGFECGDFCRSTWSSPDGRSGSIDFTAVHAEVFGAGSWSAPLRFAGPGGEWSWSWTGARRPKVFDTVNGSVPVYGAYAPIGDDWSLFRG